MYFNQLLIIVGVIFACLIHTGYAIQCYHCESDFKPECGVNFDSSKVLSVDCSKEPVPRTMLAQGKNSTSCAKIIQKTNGQESIRRECYFSNPLDKNPKCMPEMHKFDVEYISCEICNTDYCNGSGSLKMGFLTLFIAAIGGLFLK